MKILKYIILFTLIVSSQVVYGDSSGLPTEIVVESKGSRIVKAVDAQDELKEEILKVSEYVGQHWNEWMQAKATGETSSFYRLEVTDLTSVTVHPNEKEILLFIKGHTCHLGSGAFKRVYKGISFTREEEIAIAIPHENPWEESLTRDVDASYSYMTSSPSCRRQRV